MNPVNKIKNDPKVTLIEGHLALVESSYNEAIPPHNQRHKILIIPFNPTDMHQGYRYPEEWYDSYDKRKMNDNYDKENRKITVNNQAGQACQNSKSREKRERQNSVNVDNLINK